MGWGEMLGEECPLSLTAAIFQGSQKFSESRDYEDSSVKYSVEYNNLQQQRQRQ